MIVSCPSCEPWEGTKCPNGCGLSVAPDAIPEPPSPGITFAEFQRLIAPFPEAEYRKRVALRRAREAGQRAESMRDAIGIDADGAIEWRFGEDDYPRGRVFADGVYEYMLQRAEQRRRAV